jgi:hypothetical protein
LAVVLLTISFFLSERLGAFEVVDLPSNIEIWIKSKTSALVISNSALTFWIMRISSARLRVLWTVGYRTGLIESQDMVSKAPSAGKLDSVEPWEGIGLGYP